MNDKQPWDQGVHADVDALFLIRALDPPARQIFEVLARQPDVVVSPAKLFAGLLDLGLRPSENTITARLATATSFAEAFGRAPLVETASGGYLMKRPAAEAVAAALVELTGEREQS